MEIELIISKEIIELALEILKQRMLENGPSIEDAKMFDIYQKWAQVLADRPSEIIKTKVTSPEDLERLIDDLDAEFIPETSAEVVNLTVINNSDKKD